jgi:hypothetical protein
LTLGLGGGRFDKKMATNELHPSLITSSNGFTTDLQVA